MRLIHLPIHASWLNQVEIYFSILERKVLTPPDAASLDELAARILAFAADYEVLARSFEWKFTRADLDTLLERLPTRAVTFAGGGVNTSPNIRATALRFLEWSAVSVLTLSMAPLERTDDYRRLLSLDRLIACVTPRIGSPRREPATWCTGSGPDRAVKAR